MYKTMLIGFIGLAYMNSTYSQVKSDSIPTQSLSEVVVTDTRIEIDKRLSGKVISTIDAKELESYKGLSVASLLNSVSGIEINGSRSVDGQNLNYYIRGGRNRQVLILIDGIQLTDPSQIANDYDLRLLQTEQIESIEIMKGAASTLYGTGAAAAVINITLKKSSKKPFSINYSSVFGTNQSQNNDNYSIRSFNNAFNMSGSVQKWRYKLSLGNRSSSGMSALENTEEDDPFNAFNSAFNVSYAISDHIQLTSYLNYDRIKSEFDDGFSFMDADNSLTSEQYRLGINFRSDYKNGELSINAALNNIDRIIESGFPTKFEAKSLVADATNKLIINERFYTVVGINLIDNQMDSYSIPFNEFTFDQDIDSNNASFTIVDPYVNVLYASDIGLNVNTGVRLNNHSEYGSHLVYSLNPSYNLNLGQANLKLLASYSTAYITPTLYQLFEPNFGNPDLVPEENRTIEVGSSLSIQDKFNLSIVYFNRKEKSFIDFRDLGNFVFQYKNIEEEFYAKGLELESDFSVTPTLNLHVNFTYTDVDESLNLRIPEFMVNSSLAYNLTDRWNLIIRHRYNDERTDSFFNSETFESETTTLDSFTVFDLYLSYELYKSKMTIFSNVTNIFNEDFNELYGYSTKGRNINLGINLNL